MAIKSNVQPSGVGSTSVKARDRRRRSCVPLRLMISDNGLAEQLIRERKSRGIDLYDEVWDGVYIMPSMPSIRHQKLVHRLDAILNVTIVQPGRGETYPGVNVSDCQPNWEDNYRVPDLVVVLNNSRAVTYDVYLYGGPDFLVEIQSPGDDTDKKIPFYEAIQVGELLIIHRDTRKLRLLRHDGQQFIPVEPSAFQGGKWLVSEVVPLAFRRRVIRGTPGTEVQRTDGEPGNWII